MHPLITGAVEGDLDEAVLRRIMAHVGLALGAVHGRKGKPALLRSIAGYNHAAKYSPWVVLVDLDRDCDCAPTCAGRWLAEPAPQMLLRIAVRAIESWLLADHERVAELLGLSVKAIPSDPDQIENPKQRLVDLARRSRRRVIREELVPRVASGRAVGPFYTARMIEFVEDTRAGWRPAAAVHRSDSLARCVRRLRSLRDQSCRPRKEGDEP